MPLSDEDMYRMFGPTSCAPDEISSMKPIKSKIYFIVAYCAPDKQHRCFGYYNTLNAAINTLKTKWKDIEECYYDSFFIESVEEGLMSISELIEYFEIDRSTGELIKKDCPDHLKRLVNWSIG
jgi:hypothetical protein